MRYSIEPRDSIFVKRLFAKDLSKKYIQKTS